MITLTAAQVEDLGQLQYLCKELKRKFQKKSAQILR